MPNNFAFIDGQNIHLGIQARGWKLDWRRFRVHLQHSYGVSRAYYFIGYIPTNEPLYDNLRRYGYTLIFKEVVYGERGFGWVICPGRLGCSALLKKAAGAKIAFMEDARKKIERKI